MPFRAIPENTQKALALLNNKSLLLDKFQFYLAGGTSLALQIDHRVSYDLDFFSPLNFTPSEILNQLKDLKVEEIEESFGTLKFKLHDCDISFFYYPYKLCEDFVKKENISIKLASLLDIALMKITAIADRGLKKDFIDLFYISKIIGFDKILENFLVKFPDGNYYHYIKALTYFTDAENNPDYLMKKDISWKEIKDFFITETKKIIL